MNTYLSYDAGVSWSQIAGLYLTLFHVMCFIHILTFAIAEGSTWPVFGYHGSLLVLINNATASTQTSLSYTFNSSGYGLSTVQFTSNPIVVEDVVTDPNLNQTVCIITQRLL
jgi:hypothetical protein